MQLLGGILSFSWMRSSTLAWLESEKCFLELGGAGMLPLEWFFEEFLLELDALILTAWGGSGANYCILTYTLGGWYYGCREGRWRGSRGAGEAKNLLEKMGT